MPDAEDFRALARSSPWLWSTLRFTYRDARSGDPVRAWLRRPDRLRVETPDGALVQVVRDEPRRMGLLTDDGSSATVELLRAADVPSPRRRSDGLVAERPSSQGVSYDDPMYRDYRWVAALDPVELADGLEPGTGDRAGVALRVEGVAEVVHGGRPAWEAVVVTTDRYEPRCGCCSLLRDARIDRDEWGDWAERFGHLVYPTATRVRLDVGTGVCVSTEDLDGTHTGEGLEVLIEAVDEPMDDALFVEPRRSLRQRLGSSRYARPGRQEPGED
ncbi:hypothetical protein [Blastococcus sp. SYSU D00813]